VLEIGDKEKQGLVLQGQAKLLGVGWGWSTPFAGVG